ncbi:globin-like [Pollicipes pollicipes]|uniref:globin-like n=1 Tax=Pollicipes pollicipes TaxID=41117 RepID=UPI0018857C5B|nr:globin-like [Pollicipes pollicipes]
MENSEIEQIRAIWALVDPDKMHHGVEILIRLFDRYPETKAKFPRLNTSSPEVMRSSARVRAHAGRVVTSLGSIISALDDLEVVDETIFLLGESHNRRKVEAEDFQVSSPARPKRTWVQLVASAHSEVEKYAGLPPNCPFRTHSLSSQPIQENRLLRLAPKHFRVELSSAHSREVDRKKKRLYSSKFTAL